MSKHPSIFSCSIHLYQLQANLLYLNFLNRLKHCNTGRIYSPGLITITSVKAIHCIQTFRYKYTDVKMEPNRLQRHVSSIWDELRPIYDVTSGL